MSATTELSHDAPSKSDRWSVRDVVAGWREGAFGPASEEPYGRWRSDSLRLIGATVLVVLLAQRQGELSPSEDGLYSFLHELPRAADSFVRAVLQLGTLWAVGIVIAAALIGTRWRLARDLFTAGILAWLSSRLLGFLVVKDLSLSKALDKTIDLSTTSPQFPFVRLAVVTALICAAGPYLTRPTRRVNQLVVILLVFGGMYLGVAFPVDIAVGLLIGWGAAAAVHLVFGSPGGRPTRQHVAIALAELGVPVGAVQLAPVQPADCSLFLAEQDGEQLTVKVLGRDERKVSLLSRTWRHILYRDPGPPLLFTRAHQVEHEAYTILRARAVGCSSPDVIASGVAGPEVAIFVTSAPPGAPLGGIDPTAVDDAILDAVWREVSLLHEAHVTHNAIDGDHLYLSDGRVTIAGFEAASVDSLTDSDARDDAQTLVTSALLVGNERAVAAARRGIGDERLERSLAYLQPAVLTSENRVALGDRRDTRHWIADLRGSAASALGHAPPPLARLHRVSGGAIAMSLGTLFAMGVLLSQLGDPQDVVDALKDANIWWLVVAFVLAIGNRSGYGIALLGVVPRRLPPLRSIEAVISGALPNLVAPGVGSTAVQVRFLQLQGVDLASAVAACTILGNVGNIVFQGIVLVVALPLANVSVDLGSIDASGTVKALMIIVLVAAIAAAIVFAIPKFRRASLPPARRAAHTVAIALHSRRQLLLIASGNILACLCSGLCMQACLAAFGETISFSTLLVINIAASTLASLIPVPGGNTAVAAVGLSGPLVAVGVPEAAAVAAVLLNQVIAIYLPAIPGWFATRDLNRKGYL